jgi:HlyD family secretion protein
MTPKRIVPVVAGAAVVLAVAAYLVIRHNHSNGLLMASGSVEATEAALGFQLPGRIEWVGPHEGDRVHAGDTLAALDRTELTARLAQVRAQATAARALLTELEAGSRSEELAQAREGAQAAADKYADAERDYARVQRLFQGGAVSQEALDKSKLALDVAQSQRDQADQQLQLVQSGPRKERIAAQRAVVAQAEAAVHQADATLANAVISAPFDGVISVRDREPGETVAAGAPVLTELNLGDRWVRIYISEDRIGAVKLGESATISADTYHAKTYGGLVSFIASEAEFTPRNVQTAEERVKLVYAVKVRITGDPTNDLKPGMPADVTLTPVPSASRERGK